MKILSITLQRPDGAVITMERGFEGEKPAAFLPCTDDNHWTPEQLHHAELATNAAVEVIERR